MQAKLAGARKELKEAQDLLDAKQRELDSVQVLFDTAMAKKQVSKPYNFVSLGVLCVFLTV